MHYFNNLKDKISNVLKFSKNNKKLNLNINKQDHQITKNTQKEVKIENLPSNNSNMYNNKNTSKKEKKVKPLPPPTYVINHYKSTIGFFSKIYGRNDFKWRIGIAIIVGLLMSFVSLICVQNTGVYISGTSGIFQGIARIVKIVLRNDGVDQNTINIVYQLLFYGLYLLTNIPLIIFSYKKMGKKFTILSSIVVILSNVLPLILNYAIPGIKNVFVFGKTVSDGNTDLYLLNFQADDIKFAISMFLYALFAGLINGLAYAMAVAVGGSTGGLDFISFFFAYKKKKPMGTMLLAFNVSSIFISSFIGSFIAGGIFDSKNWDFYNFLSQNLISGVIYTIVVSVVLTNLFPKDKVVKIQVYAEDILAIRNYLYSVNFNHSLTINTTTGGYSLLEKKNLEVICLYIEVPKIIKKLKEIDQQMMITITPIKGIDGKLSVEEALN